MKKIILILTVLLVIFSCKKEEIVVPKDANGLEYSTVNQWLYDVMSQLYYWNYTLPVYKSSTANPNDYFATLKNKDDRFSAVFDDYTEIANALNGVSAGEVGFEFQLFRESSQNSNVIGEVSYVKPGTNAKNAGVKRGMLFRKINGQQLTMTNYSVLLGYFFDNSPSVLVNFATITNNSIYELGPISINKVANYQENPVYLDSVYTVENKKIGYLVYNFFTNDPGDETLSYDIALNNVFAKFKQQNVTELIVDLRYNHGGSMSSAVSLASMMVPNLAPNMVYAYTQFNSNYTNYFNSTEFKNAYPLEHPFYTNFETTIDVSTTNKVPVQNIGSKLQRIFFLTGSGTASASEMVINGLKPFLPCILIGDTTVGKNVGSTLVHDTENAKNKWATMPIILKYFNKDHKSDFTMGFAPDFKVNDDTEHQLGDITEGQLAAAIYQITGVKSQSPSKIPMVKRSLVKVKSSCDFKPLRNNMIVDAKYLHNFNWLLK